jgi:hypothetical protein
MMMGKYESAAGVDTMYELEIAGCALSSTLYAPQGEPGDMV